MTLSNGIQENYHYRQEVPISTCIGGPPENISYTKCLDPLPTYLCNQILLILPNVVVSLALLFLNH